MVKEQPGSNSRLATPKRKAAHCGGEAGNVLRKEELTPFGEDKHQELGQPMDEGARRCRNERSRLRHSSVSTSCPFAMKMACVAVKEP
jgi:hypothetical protein